MILRVLDEYHDQIIADNKAWDDEVVGKIKELRGEIQKLKERDQNVAQRA